jgi:hypothetical protein
LLLGRESLSSIFTLAPNASTVSVVNSFQQ